jgi:hypothetical protein
MSQHQWKIHHSAGNNHSYRRNQKIGISLVLIEDLVDVDWM